MIGWPAPASVKPASSMPARNLRRVAFDSWRRSSSPDSQQVEHPRVVADVMTGASVLENRYGRERCRSQSMISRRPTV